VFLAGKSIDKRGGRCITTTNHDNVRDIKTVEENMTSEFESDRSRASSKVSRSSVSTMTLKGIGNLIVTSDGLDDSRPIIKNQACHAMIQVKIRPQKP
jgi:hypothetical protein